MININELTKEVIENVKTQGEERFKDEVKAFVGNEQIVSMFSRMAMGSEIFALASLTDPKFVGSIRTLMWACFQVGKLGRQARAYG